MLAKTTKYKLDFFQNKVKYALKQGNEKATKKIFVNLIYCKGTSYK